MSRRQHFLAVLAAVVCFASALYAQTSFGRISGSVTDPSGAAIPNATIKIIDTETQTARTVETDASGFYTVTNLPVGPYTLEASQKGFQSKQLTGINVVADGRLTADFKLTVGDISQTVEVTSQAGEALNTTSGELSRVIETKQVENLALNGGNYVELMTLVPGVVVTNPDQFSVTTSLSATNQNINGNRSDSQNLTVDGAFNLVAGSNGSLMNNVNSNFIQELKIQTSNAGAEYGRTAGVAFNILTKNGTNEFHGSMFETFRNDSLDARNFFSVQKAKLRYNDFGYTIGGPIKKDKLFFFWGQEWKRLRQNASPTRVTVPSTAMLNGDFSAIGPIFFPGTKTPIPGNNIASLITTDGRAIANVYKGQEKLASAFNDANVSNNAILQPDNPLNYRQHLARIDYRINDKHSLYGRWISDRNSLVDPFGTFSSSNLPTTPSLRGRPGESFLLAETWLATPSVVNEFRINASWASQNIPPFGDTWLRSSYGFQFPYLYPNGTGNFRNGIPDVSISTNGYANFKGPSFSLHSPSTDSQIADSVTWIHNEHIVKAGFVMIRDRVDQNGRSSYTGNLTFNASGNNNTTGNALADALLGNFRTYSEASADPLGFFRFSQPGAFLQDSWRVNRKLSLDFGVRWEWLQPWYTQANNMANFVPALYDPSQAVKITSAGTVVPGSGNLYDGLIRAGNGIPQSETGRVPGSASALFAAIPAGAPRGFFQAQNLFSPRFGFAYAATGKTVIRGGYGIFFARPQGNMIFSQVNVPPVLLTSQFENGNLANPGGAAGVLAPNGNISAIDPNVVNGYSEQISIGVQRELPKGVFAEVSYVSTLGRHLLRQPNINQIPFDLNAANQALPSAQRVTNAALVPYKGYSNITQFRSDSTSNYNALQVYLNKRKGNVFFTAGYTYSKAFGDSSGEGDNPENYLDRHYNYGPLTFDRRQAFIGTFVWALPRLAQQNAIVRTAIGSWQLNGVIRLQTGQYYTVTGNTSIGNRRADYLGGEVLIAGSARNYNNWVNKAVFGNAPDNRFGNEPVGNVEAPGLQTYNLSVSKTFEIRERFRLRYQADFFNAFNVTNFTGLNVNLASTAFGTLPTAYPPRNIQMQLKFTF
jgi:hypothetical protein